MLFMHIVTLVEWFFCFFLFTQKLKKDVSFIGLCGSFIFVFAMIATLVSQMVIYKIFVVFYTLFSLLVFLFMMVYLVRGKYKIESAVFIASMSFICFSLISSALSSFFLTFFPFSVYEHDIQFNFLHLVLFMLCSLLLYLPLKVVYEKLENNERYLRFSAIAALIFATLLLTKSYVDYGDGQLTIEKFGQILSVVIILLMLFYIAKKYLASIEAAYKMENQRKMYETTLLYTKEIEERYTEIRKIQHDYQNTLLSLEAFIEQGDLVQLKEYFSGLKQENDRASLKSQLQLAELSHLQNLDLKSLFATKLLHLSEERTRLNIEIKDKVYLKSTVFLVRILGIILDNALEELAYLGVGTLDIGVIRKDEDVIFIIANTCRPDTLPLHQLRKEGFSTKGGNRGLGLSILTELVAQFEDVFLETTIENERFTQILTISQEAVIC